MDKVTVTQGITEPVKEWQATYSLDRHIAEARERMGEERWAELEKEWNDDR